MCLTETLVWQQRWQALRQIVSTLSTQYAQGAQRDPWLQTANALTECLEAFGQSQFDFFLDGFTSGRLLTSMYYPEEHILRATCDQVAYDTAVIQAAASQRQLGTVRPLLQKADNLAQLALDVAFENKLLPERCTAVTYLHKSPNIRVVPYAPVALIGVPPTCLTTPRDFLSIPHEVGHYLYHHAPGLTADLHGLIPIDPPWMNRWIEEVFADVYGCLVAGPAIGLSIQDLMFDNTYANLVADDGDHPVDAIRPYAYATALHALGYTQAAPLLTAQWNERLQTRHNPTTFVPAGSSTPANLTDAITAVNQATIQFVTYLQNSRHVHQPAPWSNDTTNLDELYTHFTTWVETPPTTPVYTLRDLGKNRVGLTNNGGDPVSIRQKGETKTYRDWFKREVTAQNSQVAWSAWMPIFTAGFWPVKGPEDNSDGGNP